MAMASSALKYTLHYYGSDNYLQKLGVWEIDPATAGAAAADEQEYWVVYIHGGAWRDPRVAHETFAPTIDRLLAPAASGGNGGDGGAATAAAIAGFASIDYRLSPHPQFPQDPATTPADQYRGARHPDHLDDVRSALAFLQRAYPSACDYVLVGHSAGGALAFQLLASTGDDAGAGADQPALPAAIVAFEGLYDFTGVDGRFDGAYASFFRAAFGDEPAGWDAAAPAKFAGSYAARWPGGRLALLGWSPDDTLVDGPEVDTMARRLRDLDGFVEDGRDGNGEKGAEEGGRPGEKRLLVLKDLRGDHNEIWQSGEDVARMVRVALRKLDAGL
ncbi:alpha/beta-hydrolase [Xylaria palmicola]|nr:alpha/beta-hydrolase [Xylaria palmicola]